MTEEVQVNIPEPRFIKLRDDAIIPERATRMSAGYDLRTPEAVVVPAGERVLIPTGISWRDMPQQAVGFIRPKSGLAYKFGLDVMAGVIDADYSDDIGVILHNHGSEDKHFEAGDSVAQLVMQVYYHFEGEVVTAERTGGYGSTGN